MDIKILFLLWYCLVKQLDNIIQFLLNIILIWYDKFSCNFKCTIKETYFIFSKYCNICGEN